MNINEYLELTRELMVSEGVVFDCELLKIRPRIICADGFDVSIQASNSHYCTPRINDGPYMAVEIGYPSEEVPEWMEYAETPADPLSTVYGYVPTKIVDAVLDQHGGIASGVE